MKRFRLIQGQFERGGDQMRILTISVLVITIAGKDSSELAPGTLASILKQAGLTKK